MIDDENVRLLRASGALFEPEDFGGKQPDTLTINLSDTFAWACADAEDIPPECVKEVANLYRSWGHAGILYWVSKRRDWERSEFKDINRFIDFVRREEEWKQREPSSSKRAYMDLPEDAALSALRAENERMRKALEAVRIVEHRDCDDYFYACPQSEHYKRASSSSEGTCDCGKDANNAIIDAALASARVPTDGE